MDRTKTEIPRPTNATSLDNILITMYGLDTGNWAMRPWKGDIATDHRENQSVYERLSKIGEKYGAKKIYFPRPGEFNAKVSPGSTPDAAEKWQTYQTNSSRTKILRGPLVDGVALRRREAFFISSADCPTIIAQSKRLQVVIPAHAGRECLYDKNLAQTGEKTPGREHESVVFAIMSLFKKIAQQREEVFDPGEIRVISVCGIRGGNFRHNLDDPVHGQKNRLMVKHLERRFSALSEYPFVRVVNGEVMIYLHNLAKAQFVSCGVPEENISPDGINTYCEPHTKSRQTIWHSHRRDQDDYKDALERCVKNGGDPKTIQPPQKGRNGVFVYFS